MMNVKGELELEDKVNEDMDLLKSFDNLLIAKRGFVVKMPLKGESVVACLSGGMDSVANIAILMKEYGLKVYPFFINRGQSNYTYEKRSCDYFNSFFKKEFPGLYNDYLEITVMTPGEEYKDLLRDAKRTVDPLPLRHNVSYPSRNPIIFLTGMEYAYSLKAKGVEIKTMFASYVSSDSSYHCGLTNTRLMNVLICQILNDWDWQFISIPTEREFGNFFDKDVYIKWGYENNIPLHFSRTCVKNFETECGDCPTCWDRRRGYKEAGIDDPTPYKYDMSSNFPTYYDHEKEEKIRK
jgi:7-cyano-7-deazaguanine synthase in queuosine biosynthesis